MSTSHSIELPELTHRDLTSPQYLDGCRRITSGLLEGMTPIPVGDSLLRDLATDCALATEELACRLILDRKSESTRYKNQANAKRLKLFKAVRREVKNLLLNPDPEVTDGQKEAAKRMLAVLDKHAISAKRRSQAEVSAAVQGLLADTASQEIRSIIATIGLKRLFDLLTEAQAEFAAIARKAEEAAASLPVVEPEAAAGDVKDDEASVPAASADAPSKPRLVRELKDVLSADLPLLFKLMAYQARKGRKPYAALLAQCREITAELNQVAKNRETREKKAEAKREKKEQAAATAKADPGKTRAIGNGAEADSALAS